MDRLDGEESQGSDAQMSGGVLDLGQDGRVWETAGGVVVRYERGDLEQDVDGVRDVGEYRVPVVRFVEIDVDDW